MTPAAQRAFIKALGANPRRLVVDSIVVSGTGPSTLAVWTERCSRRRCDHDDLCHAARSVLVPQELR
jgi:hypothetical protein